MPKRRDHRDLVRSIFYIVIIHDKIIHCTDLQFHQLAFDFGQMGGATESMLSTINWNRTIWAHLYEDRLFEQGMGFHPTLLRPNSRGTVSLSGPDINDHPIIDTNYLDHPEDLQILVEGMKFLKSLEETEAFRRHAIKLMADKMLCGNDHEPFSDAYFECYVREYITTLYHPVSTCRMGPKGQNSVVDSRLRVHGVRRLRVADASVMPKLVGANTNAACVMIGEKAASMILEELRSTL